MKLQFTLIVLALLGIICYVVDNSVTFNQTPKLTDVVLVKGGLYIDCKGVVVGTVTKEISDVKLTTCPKDIERAIYSIENIPNDYLKVLHK